MHMRVDDIRMYNGLELVNKFELIMYYSTATFSTTSKYIKGLSDEIMLLRMWCGV